MKLKTLFEIDEPVSWENIPPGDVEQEMDLCDRKMAAAVHAFNIAQEVLTKFANIIVSQWGALFDDLIKTNKHVTHCVRYRIAGSVEKILIPDNTPNLNKIWPIIKNYADRTVLASKMYKQNDKTRKELNKEYRKIAMSAPTTSSTKILTRTEIAALVKTEPTIKLVGKTSKKGSKGGFESPLVSCDHGLWVGPPEKYPDLTGSQVDYLLRIQKALKKAGLSPLTVLYGGRKSKSYAGINFVAIGADGRFAWRKYDPSPGSGQNWVYFNGGATMKTSEFIFDPVGELNTNIK